MTLRAPRTSFLDGSNHPFTLCEAAHCFRIIDTAANPFRNNSIYNWVTKVFAQRICSRLVPYAIVVVYAAGVVVRPRGDRWMSSYGRCRATAALIR